MAAYKSVKSDGAPIPLPLMGEENPLI